MPQMLKDLEVNEVSLVDHPANSSRDPKTGQKVERAKIVLFKRDPEEDETKKGDADVSNCEADLRALCKADDAWEDNDDYCLAVEGGGEGAGVCKAGACQTQGGQCYPRSDWAYTPDDTPSHWKLRLTDSPGGKPSARIVGAAIAALGKGFRGRKVQVPASALASVKAKVRAAWRAANPDKGDDDLPPVLKREEGGSMTLEQIEKKLEAQDGEIAALKAENTALQTENETVLKMSKRERKAFASMTAEKRKAYLAADAEKRKTMIDEADAGRKCAKLLKSMSAEDQEKFEKAGAAERQEMLKLAEAAAKRATAKDDKGGKDDEDDEEEEDMEDKEARKALTLKVASAEDRVAKTEAKLAAISKRERIQKFTALAERELPHTAGKPEEKGERLMKMADALGDDSEDFQKVLASLKAADDALAKHFTEVGKAGGAIPADKAWDAKVQSIAKRDSISIGKATERAMDEDPQLYLDYESAHGRNYAPQP